MQKFWSSNEAECWQKNSAWKHDESAQKNNNNNNKDQSKVNKATKDKKKMRRFSVGYDLELNQDR